MCGVGQECTGLESTTLHSCRVRNTMPFTMPSFDLSVVNPEEAALMKPLLDVKGFLLTCPRYDCPRASKILHNAILKKLYRDERWTVPLSWAWGMPHILGAWIDGVPKVEMDAALTMVESFIDHLAFGTPQPYQVEFQVYRVTRPDGTTFDMVSKHK